jgi:hypothetical protein
LKPRTKTILLTAVLGIVWAGAIAVGLRVLFKYETSPGSVGIAPALWPANSSIALAKDRPTLVMLAHPHCPCTRASVGELAQLLARLQGKVQAYVLFYTPRDSDSESKWEKTDLWRSAAQIPGVTVLSDFDGEEARHFGAETSGHTFLFAADGRLLFSGGITASRGHSGDNTGESAIVSLVDNHISARPRSFVFGCALGNRDQQRKAAVCLR